MKRRFNAWVFISAVIIIPVIFFVVVSWYSNNLEPLPVLGSTANKQIPFSLRNQRNEIITNESLKNKITVTDFFFTHCPSICPKMTAGLKTVQDKFQNDPFFLINSFSIDPERDSVKRLAQYASRFQIDGNWNLLTGKKELIYKLARKVYMVDASEGDGGDQDFIHSDKLVLVDQLGRIRGFYNGTDASQLEQLIKDISRLKKEKSEAD